MEGEGEEEGEGPKVTEEQTAVMTKAYNEAMANQERQEQEEKRRGVVGRGPRRPSPRLSLSNRLPRAPRRRRRRRK